MAAPIASAMSANETSLGVSDSSLVFISRLLPRVTFPIATSGDAYVILLSRYVFYDLSSNRPRRRGTLLSRSRRSDPAPHTGAARGSGTHCWWAGERGGPTSAKGQHPPG